jgi:hypothetical protein
LRWTDRSQAKILGRRSVHSGRPAGIAVTNLAVEGAANLGSVDIVVWGLFGVALNGSITRPKSSGDRAYHERRLCPPDVYADYEFPVDVRHIDTRLMFTEHLKKRMQDLLGYGLAMAAPKANRAPVLDVLRFVLATKIPEQLPALPG